MKLLKASWLCRKLGDTIRISEGNPHREEERRRRLAALPGAIQQGPLGALPDQLRLPGIKLQADTVPVQCGIEGQGEIAPQHASTLALSASLT